MRLRFGLPLNSAAAIAIAAAIRSVAKTPSTLLDEILADRSYVICFVNAHAVNLACDDAAFLKVLTNSNLLLRDGLGAKILMRAIGRNPGINMNGTDFIPQILAGSKPLPIAMYGSSAEVASAAADKLRSQGAVLVTHCDGFQPLEHYLRRIKEDAPRVVVLGMGMPKQEHTADAIIKASAKPILVINGGAILDFMSGRIRRAPAPLRRVGLEWLFRLCLEPRRLWRRYIIGNTIFLARACFAFVGYRLKDRSVVDGGGEIEGHIELKRPARKRDSP